MDDLQQEGIVGTTQGNLLYVNFGERQTVKVVSRASESLDSISELVFDPSNPAVFLTSAGDHSNEVKVFATSTMDQITTFRHHSDSPVRFIAAFTATKHQKQKLRLIGHADGELKFVTLESLKVEFAYRVDLNENEQLTKGCFSQSGHNFAVGTSHGNVYFGHFKKDQKTKTTVVKIAKLKGLSLSETHAVTSIEMTSFTPDGMLLAAFDNGEVRVWRSFYSDSDADKPKRKNLGKKPVDIADLGNMQFDIVDNFNMFHNPHGLDNLTEEDQKQLSELYSVSKNSLTMLLGQELQGLQSGILSRTK
jgi:WD40 repeat protein